jgi:hypothetical protein
MNWIEKIAALPDGERALMATIAKTWLARGESLCHSCWMRQILA